MTQDAAQKWSHVVQKPARPGNRVDYLINGWATFQSMYLAILSTMLDEESRRLRDTSSYFIYHLAWWLDDDLPLSVYSPGYPKADPASSYLGLIRKAAESGVEVRILLYNNPLNLLRGRPLRRLKSIPGVVAEFDDNLWFQAHHQKLMVIKGREGLIGFCGGIDVMRDRVQTVPLHPPGAFHDVHCRIQGDAVYDLLDVFKQRWEASPRVKQLDESARRLRVNTQAYTSQEIGKQHVAILRTFLRRPGKCMTEASIGPTILNAIHAATRFIYIEDQYMVYAEADYGGKRQDVATALGERLKSLEHITIVIPHSAISDLPDRWEARLKFMEILLRKAGKDEYWRAVKAVGRQQAGTALPPPYPKLRVFFKYEPPNGKVRLDRAGTAHQKYLPEDFGPGSYVHSKLWIFDDELAIIGSANCNRRGWNYDTEVSAAIFDGPPGKSAGDYSFAQKLRIELWSQHLRLEEDDERLVDGARPGNCWFTAEARKYVRLYNPGENTDDDPTQWKLGRGLEQFIVEPAASKKPYPRCDSEE